MTEYYIMWFMFVLAGVNVGYASSWYYGVAVTCFGIGIYNALQLTRK